MKNEETYEIDALDRKILRALMKDARTPFSDLARDFHVAPGTIHQRVAKMTEAGVITGSHLEVDHQKLGIGVTALIGVHLKNARDVKMALENLRMFDEVVEAYYTTGTYALVIKVLARDITHYHRFLMDKLQAIKEIQSTESFICLDTPLKREVIP